MRQTIRKNRLRPKNTSLKNHTALFMLPPRTGTACFLQTDKWNMLHCAFSIRLQNRIIEGIGRPDGWRPLTSFTKVKNGHSWFVWICTARKLDRFLVHGFRTTLHDLGSTSTPGHIVVSLDKTLVHDYLWWLRTSSKFGRQEYEELLMNNETLDHWILLSRCGFLKGRSSCRSEKCANCPTVSVWRCPVTKKYALTTVIDRDLEESNECVWTWPSAPAWAIFSILHQNNGR